MSNFVNESTEYFLMDFFRLSFKGIKKECCENFVFHGLFEFFLVRLKFSEEYLK